jgi:hypothetical protein
MAPKASKRSRKKILQHDFLAVYNPAPHECKKRRTYAPNTHSAPAERAIFSGCSPFNDRNLASDVVTPSANSSNHVPSKQVKPRGKFPFFCLPRELRDEIYQYACEDISIETHLNTRIRIFGGSWPGRVTDSVTTRAFYVQEDGRRPTMLQFPLWLRYNKQMRQEGLERFYRRANFTVNAHALGFLVESVGHTMRASHWNGRMWTFPYRSPLVPDIRRVQNLSLHAQGTIEEGEVHHTTCARSWSLCDYVVFRNHDLSDIRDVAERLNDLKNFDIRIRIPSRNAHQLRQGRHLKYGDVTSSCY